MRKVLAWAAVSAAVGLYWTVTSSFPAGTNDIYASLTPLRHVPAATVGMVFTTASLGLAVLLFGAPRSRPALWAGWAAAAVLLFVVPDTRILALAGYAPMLILGAPFGLLGRIDYDQVFNLQLAFQLWCVAGGLLLVRALLAWRPVTWRPSTRLARTVTYIAAAVPMVYAATRFAWVLHIPLGLRSQELGELIDSGAVWAGLGLACFATVGGILTLGLIHRWGEVFPRWMVGLAGRTVPVKLATVPASIVAVIVMPAGISFLGSDDMMDKLSGADWVAIAPMVLWPLWSVCLGLSAYAYHRRRTADGADRGTSPTGPAGRPGSSLGYYSRKGTTSLGRSTFTSTP